MTKDKKPRRDYGDGSLYYRDSDNRWVGSFYHNGKRKYVYGSVGGTKAEAHKKLKEAIKQAEAGQLIASNKQKVAEYLDYWLSMRKAPLKASTHRMHSTHVRVHMIPHLGYIHLQKLTHTHIQRFVNALIEEGLASSTIHTIYTIFNTAMNDAIEWELLAVNPCKGVVLPRVEERDYTALDREQAQVLLASLRGHRLEALITVALATGMRRGELLALKWNDIDERSGRIRIQRTLTYINGEGFKETTPKTKGSRRTIMLPRSALNVLKEHRKQQLKVCLTSASRENADLVFPGPTGGYMSFTTLQHAFARVLEQAGLPQMRFHDLRHTCATLLLSSGVSPKVVQELLGHSSIKMTMDRYGHVMPGMHESVMSCYDAVLFAQRDEVREHIN